MPAYISGVLPVLSTKFTSASHSTSKPPAAASPVFAAQWSAVQPLSFFASMSKSSSSMNPFIDPMSPAAAASKMDAMDQGGWLPRGEGAGEEEEGEGQAPRGSLA